MLTHSNATNKVANVTPDPVLAKVFKGDLLLDQWQDQEHAVSSKEFRASQDDHDEAHWESGCLNEFRQARCLLEMRRRAEADKYVEEEQEIRTICFTQTAWTREASSSNHGQEASQGQIGTSNASH